MDPRYITNDSSPLLIVGDSERHLTDALETIIARLPPKQGYSEDKVSGFWAGPTGFAYLFLHVSSLHPHLHIAGHHAITWASRYMHGARGHVGLDSARCGMASEKLAYEAVQACITKDLADVRTFVSNIPAVLAGDSPDEILHGRAGTLYMLRMVRHWVPGGAPLLEPAVQSITESILADGPDWIWHGKPYLGAVHGDIGIVTQLVLTTPSLAEQLGEKLDQLLQKQLPDGNWPSSVGKTGATLVQFCHGAPGFLHSLVSLRPYFVNLQQKMDAALEKGRQCVWREGLLRKEPSICHGIFGNALALSHGPRREHFLAFATPEKMNELRRKDKTIFEPADYGSKYATISGYSLSAAWAWMTFGEHSPRLIFYNDV
ncbi:LanC-like protein 2 [Cytospora mali]|uniref:LanC-like protein 2 n=1 Tax=Cytospora mali TaxID=578113 RepID=A0A194WCF7_CYTMA|nr:LanC-like protein 2 [Valsa mali]